MGAVPHRQGCSQVAYAARGCQFRPAFGWKRIACLWCNIPALIHISDGKTHEINVLDMLTFEAGAL